jgi:MFS family permease
LFDTLGRIPMIAGTYLTSAAVGLLLAFLVPGGSLTQWSFIAIVGIMFFFASAGASAAYLTVSEVFPMETRALAIAFFYAVGTGLGGIVGPLLFGHLIETHDRSLVMVAFLIGAGVMALGGIAELFLGVRAENAKLEDIAKPLTAEEGTIAGAEGGEEDPGERRWRERDERRSARDRSGGRRYRPGPGPGHTFYSPGMVGTAGATRSAHPTQLDGEIDAIAGAVAEGPVRREELARRVGARRWGPGRFQNALVEAESEGRIRRLSRSLYGPPG